MTFEEKHNQLKRIHFFIQRKATGTPKVLADKLETSESSVYRSIRYLRGQGAPILFDKGRGSYVYEERFELGF